MPATKKTARSAASKVFTADEKAAMKELIQERRASGNKADAEADCLAKIAEMPPSDRQMAERLHKIITSTAPQLAPKTWYGMPAYAKDGNIVCFFQGAGKFKARYATLGFTDKANIDEGEMWPTYYGLKTLSTATEAKIAKLIKRAVT